MHVNLTLDEARLVVRSDPRKFEVTVPKRIKLPDLKPESIAAMSALHDDRMWLLFRKPDEVFGEITDDPSQLEAARQKLLIEHERNAAKLRARRNAVFTLLEANQSIGSREIQYVLTQLRTIESLILAVRDELKTELYEGELREEYADREELSDLWEMSHEMFTTGSFMLWDIERQWTPGGGKIAG